ncbi:MAG: methylmalonyl Co-A mutase-associated GTPase MeaB [Phycisphaeraceae bacterium]|nr:methylmalonyl Co-A mutase-associated GTPase MeaB [Phycisphaeraceae bacterium]
MDPNLQQLVETISPTGSTAQPGAPSGALGPPTAQQIRAAAKLMTLIGDQPHRLPELFQGMTTWPQARLVLGVTGAPGSGKSTVTDHLIAEFRHRFPDRRIGIIAVDPSSPFTGGAVLGDRVRMMRHATDPMVFIRSLASRGHLGGLTLGAKGVVRILGLLGCDMVIIETVGVGQSEVEVAGVADLVTVILAPGQGDSVQMLKAGLMEVADLFVVNKADLPGAETLHRHLLQVMSLSDPMTCDSHHQADNAHPQSDAPPDAEPQDDWVGPVARRWGMPDVFMIAANEHRGIPELLDHLESQARSAGPRWMNRREESLNLEIRESVLEEARRRLEQTLNHNGSAAGRVQRVLSGQTSVRQMAQELLERTTAQPDA